MNRWIEVAKVGEIEPRTMKQVEVDGEKLVIANVDGSYHALGDRCGHMNAPLSLGKLSKNVVRCPLHRATYDVTTGEPLTDPQMGSMPGMDKLPEELLEALTQMGAIMAQIEMKPVPRFDVRVEGDSVQVRMD